MRPIVQRVLETLARLTTPLETRSARFVERYVIPDMLDNGFGFGRAAVGRALVKLRITNFDELFSLTAEELETIRNARSVGPKVFSGFELYLAKRGRLPGTNDKPVAIATTKAPERIDVV